MSSSESLNQESIVFYNWQPIRKALEDAYIKLGRPDSPLEKYDWNLVGTAIECYLENSKWKCANCGTSMQHGTEIRCLDCKATLCETCAPKHFWPDGRPDESKR